MREGNLDDCKVYGRKNIDDCAVCDMMCHLPTIQLPNVRLFYTIRTSYIRCYGAPKVSFLIFHIGIYV